MAFNFEPSLGFVREGNFIDNIEAKQIFCKTLDVDGDVDVDGDLAVTGSVTPSGNMVVTGNLTVNGNSILGNAPGDTTTINGDLNVTGDITPGSLTFNNTGVPLSVPTPITFYEEYTHNCTWQGAYGTPLVAPIEVTRLNNMVTLHLPEVLATTTSAALIFETPPLPLRFRPLVQGTMSDGLYCPILVIENFVFSMGTLIVEGFTGTVSIAKDLNGGAFASGVDAGLLPQQSVSYLTEN